MTHQPREDELPRHLEFHLRHGSRGSSFVHWTAEDIKTFGKDALRAFAERHREVVVNSGSRSRTYRIGIDRAGVISDGYHGVLVTYNQIC